LPFFIENIWLLPTNFVTLPINIEKLSKNMKKLLLLISGVLLSTQIMTAQDVLSTSTRQWTLQQCIDYAMENNITLQKSKLQKQSATEDLKGAKAALLPTVSASTNQSLGYQPWKDTGISTVTNGQVNTKVDKTYYNGSYSLSGQWTVWNGNRNINTIKLDKLAEQSAELQAQETANTIQERIAQIYTQILYLAENVKVNEEMLVTSKKNEERGQEMLNVGKMSKADLAQLSAQRANDEYNIVEAKSQLMNYKLQLKQLLELTDEEEFDVVIPEISDAMIMGDISSLQSVYEQALLNRPEIERSQLAIKSSDVNVSIAKAGWLPSVSLTGGVTTSTNSLSSTDWGKQMKSNVNTQLGVGVNVPIYDGRSTKTQVNKAKIQQLQAKLDLQDLQKTLYTDIQQFWLNAWTNQEKYQAAKSSVESAHQSYDLLSEQFRLGLKNIVELMAGKDKLLSAQQNQLQSKYLTIYNKQMLQFYQNGELK
jgi:outer membrane protein